MTDEVCRCTAAARKSTTLPQLAARIVLGYSWRFDLSAKRGQLSPDPGRSFTPGILKTFDRSLMAG
jgi:hypothetical protein